MESWIREGPAMWGLEYALYFGVPNNKIELIDGRSRWAVPFADRELAEAHFAQWLETLCRWKQVRPAPPVRKTDRRWKVKVGRIRMELFPRPIELRIPMVWEAFDGFLDTFWWPEMWPGEPAGRARGRLAALDHQDVQLNLWSLFGEFCARHGGTHSGRVDIALSDSAAGAPGQYYFRKGRPECMIERDYFQGVPDLIAEVLSPASRALDWGPRQELYRRTGVPHLWLVDPEFETVEVYELVNHAYHHVATHRAGEEFQPVLFPGETVPVDRLFRTQLKQNGQRASDVEPRPIPEWIVPPEKKLGLECFFLLGHPERRWEIWGNKAPSVLAFGSPAEAKARSGGFLQEACQWEGAGPVAPHALDPDNEQAEVGRFKLRRSGRHIHLDVTVDARKYRELLQAWTRRDAWDWGEKPRRPSGGAGPA